MGKRRVFVVKPAPTTGQLGVQVVDERGQPVEGAEVRAYPGSTGQATGADGFTTFESLPAGPVDICAGKAGYAAVGGGPEGVSSARVRVAAGSSVEHTLTLHRLPIVLTENIVIVGSERWYNSFKMKMMFIGPAFAVVSRGLGLRPADSTTVLYADHGYTRHEKLALDLLGTLPGVRIVAVTTVAAIVRHFNARPRGEQDGHPTKTLIQDVYVFSHGFPNRLALNASKMPGSNMDFTEADLRRIDADVFVPNGRVLSYACRTGVSLDAESFPNDAAAKPEHSLARKMADHFGIEVLAYLRRTDYAGCTVPAGGYDALAKAVKDGRDAAAGGVIDLPPDHQALPHPGINGFRTRLEGTQGYALWRKQGAIALPVAAATPTGLSPDMRRFRPYE